MSINVNVGGNTGPLERDVRAAMDRINRAGGLKIRVDDKGVTQPLGNMKRSADEFSKSLEASNARVLAFGASVGIINAVSNAFKGLVQQTIQVEKNLTDINVVMGLTTKQLDKFGGGLFKVAAETGAGFQAASEAATEFARQGLSVTETLKRTKDALILTRLTGMKAAESVKSLTAAMNTFKGEVNDSTVLVSKFAAVDVKFAVSAEDFAQAIARAGASARDAGVDINELIGVVAAVQERTARGGAVIGNAFKTIFTRLRRSSTLQELENLGIAVRDLRGSTLPAMKILEQLASKYDHLTDSQKSYISQNVAGVFQINMLKAAMADLGQANSVTAQATAIASRATDESTQKNEQLRNTMAALATETGVAIQELAKKIGDIALAPGINKILDGVKGMADFANNLLGDGEKEGNKFAQNLLGGIGNFISGPGLVLITAVVSKLFVNATKYGMQSLQSLLGMNKASTARKHTEQAILQVLANNSALSKEMLRTDISREKKEQMILSLIKQQTVEAQKLAAVSKQLTMPLIRAGVTPNLSMKRANGFIPNFAMDKSERQLAAEGGYAAGAIKDMNIPGVGNVTYNTAEDVKKFPGMTQPAIVPPQGSKAGNNYDLAFQKAHGFSPYASGGFVPNFARPLRMDTSIDRLNKFTHQHLGMNFTKNSPLAFSTGHGNTFGPGGAREPSFSKARGHQTIYLDANKVLGEPFMKTMGVMVGQGSNTLQKKNYTTSLMSVPALKPLKEEMERTAPGSTAKTRIRVGIHEKGLYPVDDQDVNSVSKGIQGSFRTTLQKTPGLTEAMDNLALGMKQMVFGQAKDDVKINKGAALGHVLGESAWRGYMLEAGIKSAFGRKIDTGKESQRAFDLEGAIPQPLRDFMGMPLLRALELKSTEEAAGSGNVANKVFNRIFNDYANGKALLSSAGVTQTFNNNGNGRLMQHMKGKLGMAGGYIPNFANPLLEAIGREREAGVPVSQIRVGSHNALRDKSNPMGIGVTNTSDEPNGLKDVFGANGFVPNYAALRQTTAAGGHAVVTKNQQKLIDQEVKFLIKELKRGSMSLSEVQTRFKNLGQNVPGLGSSFQLTKKSMDNLTNKVTTASQKVGMLGNYSAGSQNPGTGGIINQLLNRGGGAGTGVGGFLGRMNSSEGALGRFTNGMGGMGMMMGLSMGSSFVRGDDPTNAARSSLAGGMESASIGASMGMMFGPLGMAIGGAAGAIYGLVDGFDKAAEAAKKLAEENLAAAASATSAAISFALQNEKMNRTFDPTGMGSVNVNTIEDGNKLAIRAARPSRGRRPTDKSIARQADFDAFAKANNGKVYLREGGGYTANIDEAKTKQQRLSRSSTMNFQDAINSFGGNVGPKSSMGEYINALSNMKPGSLKDISKSLGLDNYRPAKPAMFNKRGGLIRKADAGFADPLAITAETKDKEAIVDLRQKFISDLFDTDLERSKTYTFQQGGKDVTKTGEELIEDLGSMDLEDALKISGQLFDQLSEEAKKSIEQMKINRAQMARRINFERALLNSQSKFADRMYGLNMQHLKQTSAVERTLKLYANSMSASAKSELKFTQQRMGIDKKLNDEKLKAAQAFKEQTIKFLNSDGGTGIGQELKNVITNPDNQQMLSSLVGGDFANQINAAKGKDGGVEGVLAGLSVEQMQSLVAGLNEAKLENSAILDFLNQQIAKMKNANEAADQAANLSKKKLDYEIETQRVLDSRVDKLKEINRLLDLQSDAAQFASKAMRIVANNANLDDQIALARIGGGTASQKFGAKRVAAQRNYNAEAAGRQMQFQAAEAGRINKIPGFSELGLFDGDVRAQDIDKMSTKALTARVKSILSDENVEKTLGGINKKRQEAEATKMSLQEQIKSKDLAPLPLPTINTNVATGVVSGKEERELVMEQNRQREETIAKLQRQIQEQEKIVDLTDKQTSAIKSARDESEGHLDSIQQKAEIHASNNKLLDEQFAKTQKLAKIQHDFVYGENSFANGMNKALMEASDRAERFKHDLGYALPQMFADNMTNAMMKISKGESFGDAMLEAGIAFVDEINRMLIKANMDKMLQGILGDKGKSEATLAKEATQGLKQAVEGTLSSEISKLSQSINTLANKIGRGMYQGGAIKKFNSGGPVRMNSGGSVGDFFRAQSNKALNDTVKNLTGSMTTLTQATQVAAEKQFSLAEFFSSPLDQAAAINPGAESKIAGDFRADEMNMRNNPAGIAQDNSIYTGEQPGGSAAAINPGALSLDSSVDVQETKVQEKMVTEQLVQKLNEFGTTITSTKTTLATFGTNVQQISQAIAQATAAIKQAVQEIKMQKAAMAAAGGAYQGGRIPGALRPIGMNTGGNVPAMLTSGEFVMNRRAVGRLGQANMALLNQGTIPAFNEGGPSFGADFASGIGSGLGSMGMSMALGGLSNWMNEKLGNNEKGRQWERPDDAFQKNRAYKRNKMSAYYMQNSADVKREAADIRMQKEKKLQEWIAKQNQKQDFWRGITTMVGQAGLNALGNQLSSSEGFGSSTVKDSQGNVMQESFTKADGTQGTRDRRMSFFDKADNTLGYKSAFMGMSQKAHSQDHRAFMNDPTNNDAISARVMENYKMEQAYNNQKNFEANNRFSFGGYNTGGRVAGPAGIDRVPAMLSEGEYVINARAAKKIGMPMLEGLNAGKYNEGGLVKDSTTKPGAGAKSEGMTNNISINVTVSGNSTQESSKNNSTNAPSDQRAAMDDLGKKIKQQVITVIREENRPGGLLG